MSLHAKLLERQDNPLRIGLIGAGKFGAMYIAQVLRTPGVHLVGIADVSPANAKENLRRTGWPVHAYGSASLDAALKERRTHLSDDWEALVRHPGIDIIIESTGNPPAAIDHALAAFRNRKHVVMVTVEADALCGFLLAQKAAEAGVVYSLAYGDQPALICDLVDWARASGFAVVAAGRGHKWQPHFAQSTPETVWGVFVVFEGETDYIKRCFEEYGVKTDPSGRYACLYKRWHLIGLEAGISVASVGLRGEPTGCPTGWCADAVAVAKRDLKTGEILDGEGGYTVVGRLMPSETSVRGNCLPLGLAQGWKLLEPVAAGQPLRWSTVAYDTDSTAVRLRREMEFAASRKNATQVPGLSPILGVRR